MLRRAIGTATAFLMVGCSDAVVYGGGASHLAVDGAVALESTVPGASPEQLDLAWWQLSLVPPHMEQPAALVAWDRGGEWVQVSGSAPLPASTELGGLPCAGGERVGFRLQARADEVETGVPHDLRDLGGSMAIDLYEAGYAWGQTSDASQATVTFESEVAGELTVQGLEWWCSDDDEAPRPTSTVTLDWTFDPSVREGVGAIAE